ncbi:MAG: succinylglutamate desuccinylase/aspartoacylase family protein [Rhodospirillales bacterium]|nr:succinylglutamate desuccinylase/aspartoacylase family protein [Rhodospirillales bacterium]
MPTQTYPVELTAPNIEAYRKGNTGIDFVTTFDSALPGPHVMINAVTHGNEICGAIALDRLFKAGIAPVRGKLTLAFVNVAAFLSFDPADPDASRLVDEDFNRVWLEERLDSDEDSTELRRARALRPLFDSVDYLLDIHSLGTYSEALTICHGHQKEVDFARKMNYPGYIMAGSGHVVGRRLIEYTPFNDPANGKVALLVECGQHWAASSATIAFDTALHFLQATGAVDPAFFDAHISEAARNPAPAQVWDVVDGIWSKTEAFAFSDAYIGMEVIEKAGTVIATDGAEVIVTPHDDCLLMMPSHKSGANIRKLRLCKRR